MLYKVPGDSMAETIIRRRKYGLFIYVILRHLLTNRFIIYSVLFLKLGSATMFLASLEMGLKFSMMSIFAVIALIVGVVMHELVHFVVLDTDVYVRTSSYLIKLNVMSNIDIERSCLAAIAGPLVPALVGFISLYYYPDYFLALLPLLLQSVGVLFDLVGVLGLDVGG